VQRHIPSAVGDDDLQQLLGQGIAIELDMSRTVREWSLETVPNGVGIDIDETARVGDRSRQIARETGQRHSVLGGNCTTGEHVHAVSRDSVTPAPQGVRGRTNRAADFSDPRALDRAMLHGRPRLRMRRTDPGELGPEAIRQGLEGLRIGIVGQGDEHGRAIVGDAIDAVEHQGMQVRIELQCTIGPMHHRNRATPRLSCTVRR